MGSNRNRLISYVLGIALIIALIIMGNINSQKNELEKTVQAQSAMITELKNGAERRISEIRTFNEKKQFKELYSAAAELVKLHPGSKEAKEAEGYVVQAQNEEAAILAKAKEEEAAALAKKRAEEERQKELAERSAMDKVRSIIRVSRVITDDPNSAGGVDLRIVWQNTSDKAIKYVSFTVVPYNAVNDIVSCTIRRESEFTGRVTGPINPGQWYGEGTYWQCPWYNNSIVRAELRKIRIEYINGTTEILSGQDVNYVQF